MVKVQYIAHVKQSSNGGWLTPHDLVDHLNCVAIRAADHARPFGGQEWAHLAGLWHDLGKFRSRFQQYIRKASGFDFNADASIKGEAGKAPHSTAGALLACDRFKESGRVLAYLIAGHHAGLYDWHSESSSLEYRLQQVDSREELDQALAEASHDWAIRPYFSLKQQYCPSEKYLRLQNVTEPSGDIAMASI